MQYASGDYQQELDAWGIDCSMSRRGNCYDNAAMENFFGSLKTELVHHEAYETRQRPATRSSNGSRAGMIADAAILLSATSAPRPTKPV